MMLASLEHPFHSEFESHRKFDSLINANERLNIGDNNTVSLLLFVLMEVWDFKTIIYQNIT